MADTGHYYDEEAAERAVDFFPECLVHVKGALAGKPFELLEWQKVIIRDLFGWKRPDGTRRYRKAYIEIPRKCGKSTFAAGIAIYLLLCDGEQGAEVYSAASTRDQASLVYQMAAAMLRKSDMLSKHVKIRDSVKRIIAERSDSFYRAISADAEGAHGFNAHGIIFDEVHTQPTRDLWDVLDTSTGARAQPLTVAITTAGHDRSSICWELHQYAVGVRDGGIKDDSFYPVIFAADPEDDWEDEKAWEKANPSIDVAITRDYLREQANRARENPAFENTFRRLHLNQWTEQERRIIQMHRWDACKQDYTEAELHGRSCYVGLDMASTTDVTAMVLVFGDETEGCKVLPWFWIPEEAVNQRTGQDQRMIRNYASRGRGNMRFTSGDCIDLPELTADIWDILQHFDVQKIGFDPFSARDVHQRLMGLGIPESLFVQIPQTTGNYNEAFKQMLSWLSSGKFAHDGDEILRWMASNVAHHEDRNGHIRPDKKKSADKIDGIAATLMGMKLQIQFGVDVSVYSQADGGIVLI